MARLRCLCHSDVDRMPTCLLLQSRDAVVEPGWHILSVGRIRDHRHRRVSITLGAINLHSR